MVTTNSKSEAESFDEDYFNDLLSNAHENFADAANECGRLRKQLKEQEAEAEFWQNVKKALNKHVSFFKPEKTEAEETDSYKITEETADVTVFEKDDDENGGVNPPAVL
ncbi:MAG: hypothetical protein LBU81_02840 [Methanosarcinales archaeon]|jgi:hypothetical protein|nr:hypothetical protein [Methanosarcinales archaeon]